MGVVQKQDHYPIPNFEFPLNSSSVILLFLPLLALAEIFLIYLLGFL